MYKIQRITDVCLNNRGLKTSDSKENISKTIHFPQFKVVKMIKEDLR